MVSNVIPDNVGATELELLEDELLEVLLDELLVELLVVVELLEMMLDVMSEELLETVELGVLLGANELDVDVGLLQPIIIPRVIAPRSIDLMSVFFIIRSFLVINAQ